MEETTGQTLAELLLSQLQGAEVEDVYLDQDEDGNYLGVVFSDGETEYHLTFQEDGTVELAKGPVEGESLEEVAIFDLGEVEPPFSEDSAFQI